MSKLLDEFEEERKCEYKGEFYSVRDNGSIMRHAKSSNKIRPLDNQWIFGKINVQKGYPMISSEPVHRIVAIAFLGEPPTNSHVVDHIDTNRQNNRPSNLRWVTRLENIVLNEITRKKIELLCGCSIEEILMDITILQNKQLPPQFNWMKTVSKEEAERSLETWKKWTREVSELERKDKIVMQSFKHKTKQKTMIYPLEPMGAKKTLENYCLNLAENSTFCYKDYSEGRVKFKVIEYFLNKETKILSVATRSNGGIKSLFLTSITVEENEFNYDTRSFFSPDGIEKYMTIAKGEEWTGGEVFDDLC